MISQILELHHGKGLGIKAVARTLGVARNTVREHLRAHAAAAKPATLEPALATPASSAPTGCATRFEVGPFPPVSQRTGTVSLPRFDADHLRE